MDKLEDQLGSSSDIGLNVMLVQDVQYPEYDYNLKQLIHICESHVK